MTNTKGEYTSGGYSTYTSVFTAPKDGYYFFHLFFQTYNRADTDAAIYKGGILICMADSTSDGWHNAGCSAITWLDEGDEISVKVIAGGADFYNGERGRATGFTGFLLR